MPLDSRPTQTWIAPLVAEFPESPHKHRVIRLARLLDVHLAKPAPRVGLLDAHREEGNTLWWRLNQEYEALEQHHRDDLRRQRVMFAAAAVVTMMTVGSLAVAGMM